MTVYTSTGKTPSELLYRINPRYALELGNPVNASASDDWAKMREALCKNVADAISHAQNVMKENVDKSSQEFILKAGNKAFIHLNKGYHLPSIFKAKIGQQRVGPFEVEAVVGTNAYKLKLPPTWRVWPIISSVYLDKATADLDPFDRDPSTPTTIVTDDAIEEDHWKVTAVVRKCIERSKVKYLVHWKGFGPEDNWWINEDELKESALLIMKYEHMTGNTQWQPPVFWNLSLDEIHKQGEDEPEKQRDGHKDELEEQRDGHAEAEPEGINKERAEETTLHRSTRLHSR